MKSFISKILIAALMIATGAGFVVSNNVSAEGESDSGNNDRPATSITITPVNKIMQLTANTVYDDSFTISNNGSSDLTFEVYASPYSYNYSEETGSYQLGFNKENTYTQITRWITFQNTDGEYVEKARFTAEPDGSVEVKYRVSTPSSIPAGGQYAVLFAHTVSDAMNATGIMTEASPGLVLYGRGEGETKIDGEISNLDIQQTKNVDGESKNIINGTGKVKNTGNVDFMAYGALKVSSIFGNVYYETATNSTKAHTSVIPDSELVVSDSWDETPFFGLFNVEWTVSAAGGLSETITKQVLILPTVIVVIMILLLTIIIVWIIISIRKRRERRSRFMV